MGMLRHLSRLWLVCTAPPPPRGSHLALPRCPRCRPSLFKAVLKVMGWRVYVMVGLEATFRGMWILRCVLSCTPVLVRGHTRSHAACVA